MASANLSKKRIVIIGKAGVGKSSIIRYMGGVDNKGKKPTISNKQPGETFENSLYENEEFIFADTIGFGETNLGGRPSDIMIKNLVVFLLDNSEGFNLVMYVIDNDRIDISVKNTYKVLSSIIKSSVPKILVRTGDTAAVGELIPQDGLDEWERENCTFINGCRVSYANIDKMIQENKPARHIEVAQENINISNQILRKLIGEHSNETPEYIYQPTDLCGVVYQSLLKFHAAIHPVGLQ
ncbi:unnamed protein product [Rotaria socialis]|uniref:G domain-containing protein n=1 Tax=Rotaria socialis TaxID=392032 RepID=A0A821TA47_9BILA|nr:unnamed protein product [Rotaria socialis]CAF4872110.1 unnamed protein product [Rotaria socialis]